jgi:hypothetical protein
LVVQCDWNLRERLPGRVHARQREQYEAQARPFRQAIQRLEEPIRSRLQAAKLGKQAEELQLAHLTPAQDRTAEQQDRVERTHRFITVSQNEVIQAVQGKDQSEHQLLVKQLQALDPLKPARLPVARGLSDQPGPPPRTFLLERGERGSPAAEVHPGFPLATSRNFEPAPAHIEAPFPGTTGRRAALASWITSPQHPLTARVKVNRLWQHHFGRGIVATASDFGLRGHAPTHPELLDWLAVEFMSPAARRLLAPSSET